jgi:uncharacterized membrane protein YfhO
MLDINHDFREASLVEEAFDGLETGGPASSEVAIELDEPEEVRIRSRAATAGLLVLSDRYDPNWRVTVDGRRARALRVNYVFRGVAVPAGEHEVAWTYCPASFVWGCWISAITLFVLLALLVVSRFTEPR